MPRRRKHRKKPICIRPRIYISDRELACLTDLASHLKKSGTRNPLGFAILHLMAWGYGRMRAAEDWERERKEGEAAMEAWDKHREISH